MMPIVIDKGDHLLRTRLNQNFALAPILEGKIDEVVQTCIARDQQAKLEAMAAETEAVPG